MSKRDDDVDNDDVENDEVSISSMASLPGAERVLAARYGIAEWYGKDIVTMTTEERQEVADIASKRVVAKPICPFMAKLKPGALCSKKGGVCTIRKYEKRDGVVTQLPNSPVVTNCPNRFLGTDEWETPALAWVAEKMIDTNSAIMIKETQFLEKLLSRAATQEKNVEAQIEAALAKAKEKNDEKKEALAGGNKKAGRIDWILLDPETEHEEDPIWCALETQAVYFSGGAMMPDFEAYADFPDEILFPLFSRRPDYRSCGPKRLGPQLSVKVPVLRAWHKRVAVLVDRYFFDNMSDLPEAYIDGRNEQEKRDNSEVVWFIVDYDENMDFVFSEIRYSTLLGSVEALNAVKPLSKTNFNETLRTLINDPKRHGKKVFRS